MSRWWVLALAGAFVATPLAAQEAGTCTPGAYAVATDGTLTPMTLTQAHHRKVSGMLGAALLGPIGGNKMKVKTVLDGPGAVIRVSGPRPTFRFCFTSARPATGDEGDYVGATPGAVSTADFRLVRLERRGRQRELALTAVGGFGGPKDELGRSTIAFDVASAGANQVTVRPREDLPPGEYGFLGAVTNSGTAAGKRPAEEVYDFAVTG